MQTIGERLKALIDSQVTDQRRFKVLAELSEHRITAEAWRAFWNDRQKPSAEMIAVIARAWPQFAFWLATAISDSSAGHIAPPGAAGTEEADSNEDVASTAYFKAKLALHSLLSDEASQRNCFALTEQDEDLVVAQALHQYGGEEKFQADLDAYYGPGTLGKRRTKPISWYVAGPQAGPEKVLYDLEAQLRAERTEQKRQCIMTERLQELRKLAEKRRLKVQDDK
ncbi:hypothetical protein K6W21_21515 [Burkholderia latens]|uniref:hypothetical protein n=1 Tax=Burkholderia latens TaxID=488446 RepID=UPI001C98C3AA|nr:hypothetical protein [Burkholderia latens]MBY4696650.1 hypothetical protein [Burkholderia latens]